MVPNLFTLGGCHRRDILAAILCAVLLLLAGCSALQPGETSQTTTPADQLDCNQNNPFGGVPLDAALPAAPDGWERTEAAATATPSDQDGNMTIELSLGIEQADAHAEAVYETPNGSEYFLSVTRWPTTEQATANTANMSAWFPIAVVDKTRFVVLGPNASTAKPLLAAAPCVTDDAIEYNPPELDIDSNVSVDAANSSVNPDSEATITAVETSLGRDALGPYVNVTVEGTFENATLLVDVEETDATTLIASEDLADGTATTQLRLSQDVLDSAGTYTVNVSAQYSDASRTTTFEIEPASFELRNLAIEAEAGEYTSPELTTLEFDIVNTGGLAARLTEVKLVINGENNSVPLSEDVTPGETLTFSKEEYPLFTSGLTEGQNEIRIIVYAGGEQVAATETTVRAD